MLGLLCSASLCLSSKKFFAALTTFRQISARTHGLLVSIMCCWRPYCAVGVPACHGSSICCWRYDVLIAGGGGEDDMKGEVLFQHKFLNVTRGEEVHNSCCTLYTLYTNSVASSRRISQPSRTTIKEINWSLLKIYSKFGLLKLCKNGGRYQFWKICTLAYIQKKEKVP